MPSAIFALNLCYLYPNFRRYVSKEPVKLIYRFYKLSNQPVISVHAWHTSKLEIMLSSCVIFVVQNSPSITATKVIPTKFINPEQGRGGWVLTTLPQDLTTGHIVQKKKNSKNVKTACPHLSCKPHTYCIPQIRPALVNHQDLVTLRWWHASSFLPSS